MRIRDEGLKICERAKLGLNPQKLREIERLEDLLKEL
jgi:hypothetical protein